MKDQKDNVPRDLIDKPKNTRGGWRVGGRPKNERCVKVKRGE